jgi:hypothetical protein
MNPHPAFRLVNESIDTQEKTRFERTWQRFSCCQLARRRRRLWYSSVRRAQSLRLFSKIRDLQPGFNIPKSTR